MNERKGVEELIAMEHFIKGMLKNIKEFEDDQIVRLSKQIALKTVLARVLELQIGKIKEAEKEDEE